MSVTLSTKTKSNARRSKQPAPVPRKAKPAAPAKTPDPPPLTAEARSAALAAALGMSPEGTPVAAAPLQTMRRLPGVKPEYQAFAKRVREAMLARKLSASDLARAIWGTTTDYRGYPVARNRDRIGHYLAAVSYPEPENLKKMADALGLGVEDLELPEGTRSGPYREPRSGMTDTQITMLHAHPGVGSLQLRKLLTIETIMKIMTLLEEDQLPESLRDQLP